MTRSFPRMSRSQRPRRSSTESSRHTPAYGSAIPPPNSAARLEATTLPNTADTSSRRIICCSGSMAPPFLSSARSLSRCDSSVRPPSLIRTAFASPRVHPRGRAAPDPSPDAISPLHPRPRLLSTIQAFGALPRALLCPLLLLRCGQGRIPPPSVLQLGHPADLPWSAVIPAVHRRPIDQAQPIVEGGLHGRVPAHPDCTTPRIGSCPSPRTFVPRFLQTPPRGGARALSLSFGSTHTWTGTFTPEHDRMYGTHAGHDHGARHRIP